MNRLPKFSAAHPKIVLGAWLIIILAAAFFAMKLDGALSAGGFTNPRAEAITTQKIVERVFDEAPNQVLVAVEGSTPIQEGDINALSEVLIDAGADSVQTPATNPGWKSTDGKTVVLAAGFPGDNSAIQNLTPTLQKSLSDRIDASVFVTGQPALDYQLNVHSKEDAVRAELIVFPILLVILLLVFRSVAATLVPLVLAGSALAISNALGYLATQFIDISLLYTNIVSMIGLAVAVDYSLFIVKRYREELGLGRAVPEALSIAFNTAGRSVIFSGVAVVVALSALFIPNLMAFTSIAMGGIIVTLTALLLTMTALPAALRLLGKNIEWGTVGFLPRFKASRTRTRSHLHPGVIAAAGVAVMLLASTPLLGISLQSPVASATVLPENDAARVGLELVEKKIGHAGLFPIQIVVTASDINPITTTLNTVRSLTNAAEQHDGVADVVSVTTLGYSDRELTSTLTSGTRPPGVDPLWTISGGQTFTRLIIEPTHGPDSLQTHTLIEDLRAKSLAIATASTTIGITGATAQGLDFDQTLLASIPWIIALVFTLSLIMLTIAFKAILLPLLALAFNTLVVLASLGLLTAFVNAFGSAPMNSVTPILLFAVMFGLSMDYMVIIISRIVEAYRGGLDFDEAVREGTVRTRGMINSAALLMAVVFLAFTSAQISIVREIGIGLAIAVVLDAVVIRIVIMPAVLRVIGPRVLGRRRDSDKRTSSALISEKQRTTVESR